MSDNEAEVDVSFLPGPGQGGTSKRAVYEPDNAQRCKQVVCSRNWAVAIVAFFSLLVLTIAVIAAFARPSQRPCSNVATEVNGPTPSPSAPSPPMATNGQPFPWTDIRLPDAINPLNYDLFLHPNLTTFKFLGTVSIQLQVKKVTNFIVLHSKGLNISNYEVVDFHSTRRNITVMKMLEYPKHEQIYLLLKKDLSPSKRYTLILTFHGELSDLMAGFYRSSYVNNEGQVRYLATTQFEATDARRAFPCFDEPSLKATFELTMVRDQGHISLFNMPLVKTDDFSADGLKQDKFEASVKMSTYLVAFIVCDFTYIQNTTSRGTRVSVYAPKNQIQQAEFALEAAVVILEYYELFFGIPYPLPKQDLIAIPDFAPGAMENWGLITYRMTALLYDPLVSTEDDKKRVAIVIAHELAHQWFGNLVTMQWWNDLWLNEGFASFVEYIGADRVNPEWHMMDQFVAETLVGALYKDSLSNSHPVSVPVNDPSEISEIFDAISYNKGASIIRMLEALISRDSLQIGLKNYLSKFKYQNARTDDLWQALSESLENGMGHQESGLVNIKEFMDRYTMQMGYPVVMVSRRGTNVVAQQQQFLLHQNTGPVIQSPFENKWHIPLTYVTDENPASSSGIQWMKDQSLIFDVPADIKWIKMNVNYTGYYRVHYDENNWKSLTQQLKDNKLVFSVADRAELLDDSFALARSVRLSQNRSGLMSATTALGLAQYLKSELMYIPWSVALGNLEDIAFLLEGTAAYDDFVQYYHELMDDVLNEFGMKELANTLERDLRSSLITVAVKYNKPEWVANAMQMFQDWMNKGIAVKPEFKLAVYRAGVQYGREKEWEFVWKQYKETDVPSEKRHLLGVLSTTRDANKLPRLLEMSLEDDMIRKQDTVSLVAHIADTTTGRVLAWNFLKQRWPEFSHRYGDGAFEMSTLINSVAGGFKTQHDYDEVKSFFEKNPVPAAKRAIAQSLERIEMNRDWMKINLKVVTKWLSENVQNPQWR